MREDAPCCTAATQNSIPVRVNSIALAMSASFQFRFFVGVGGGRRFFAAPPAHRTAGLWREEVAQRANVGTAWYIIRYTFAVFPRRRLIR